MKPKVGSSRRIALPIDVVNVKHTHIAHTLDPVDIYDRIRADEGNSSVCISLLVKQSPLFAQFEVGFLFLHNSYRFICLCLFLE